jgi:hypothetical protein
MTEVEEARRREREEELGVSMELPGFKASGSQIQSATNHQRPSKKTKKFILLDVLSNIQPTASSRLLSG